MMSSACGFSAQGMAPAGSCGRWNRALVAWAREAINRFSRSAAIFEQTIHDFSAFIETTENPLAVEAALLRQARQMVPAYRVELVTGGNAFTDCEASVRRDLPEPDGDESLSRPDGGRSGKSLLEVPLRCGSIVRGRLRVRPRTESVASLRKNTIRRLNTLCTIGACALDRLYRHDDWPWDDDVAHLGNTREVDPNPSETTILHDATFLNAVLPFALNQARRHREPLSLVCVAIDRLSGIQKLLGRAAVDQLVRKVGETVTTLIRNSDIVARLDDDRIIAVLPRAPGKGALDVARKICSTIFDKNEAECVIPQVTVTIGVATFPSCADNVYALFDAADNALAQAQRQGRNQVVLAPPRSSGAPDAGQAVARTTSCRME
jgi:diguanylate cyclase (GGDEF)-like protein